MVQGPNQPRGAPTPQAQPPSCPPSLFLTSIHSGLKAPLNRRAPMALPSPLCQTPLVCLAQAGPTCHRPVAQQELQCCYTHRTRCRGKLHRVLACALTSSQSVYARLRSLRPGTISPAIVQALPKESFIPPLLCSRAARFSALWWWPGVLSHLQQNAARTGRHAGFVNGSNPCVFSVALLAGTCCEAT